MDSSLDLPLRILYKLNASISGAKAGCQGEAGVVCSMAAGALCEALGGSPAQVENVALGWHGTQFGVNL